MKKSSRGWNGGNKFKHTKTKIHFSTSGVLSCWRIWESGLTGSRMFQSCVVNIVPTVCLLVQSTTEECAVC